MIDIETQLRSYQKASNIRGETRLMCGRAADEIKSMRTALCWGIGAALNEMKARSLPLEWSPEGGIGKMLAALGVTATKMTPEVWDVVQGKILRVDGEEVP